MFALLPMGRYGAILGQNHKNFNEKSLKIGKNAYSIVISILNPDKYSYGKYHKLSFLMSLKTWFVYFIYHFGAK
jgi:hypothetical protein